MRNRIVLYHSGTGNNQFLAEQIARALKADLQPLRPRVSSTALLYLLSLLKWGSGVRLRKTDLQAYHEVIVVGPVWGGLLIAPLRDAIQKSAKYGRPVHFATCCGCSDDLKDHRYGYAQVLDAALKAGKGYVKTVEAFPVVMALPPGEEAEGFEVNDIRLTEENFTPVLQERLARFVQKVKDSSLSRPASA